MALRRWLVALLLLVATLAGLDDAYAQLAHGQLARYRDGPNGILQFADEQFKFVPDKWQVKALRAFADPTIQRISLQACAGPGKTAVLAICGWYFLATQCTPGEHPKGLVTSITADNLRDNLWSEYAHWMRRSPFLSQEFVWSADRIFHDGDSATWFLAKRAWPKTGNTDAQGATFSGLHAANVLVEVDEAGGIPSTVLRAGEQALANAIFAKLLIAGNPISLEGMLYEVANRLRAQWFIVSITGDPDDADRSPRVDIAWARQQIDTYGRDNPWVMAYILGKFPPASINALLSLDEVEAAMGRHLQDHEYSWAQKRLGVDVARFGDDRSVIFPRQGLACFKPVVMRNVRTTAIAARVAKAVATWHAEVTFVDDTGHFGHGVIDNLLTAGLQAIPVVFSDPAINPRYFNRRAEMWLDMSDAIKSGAALPNIPEMVAELTVPTYSFLNGKFILEDKDQIKKRLGRSPDLADALALTYAIADMPNEVVSRLQRAGIGTGAHTPGKVATDYDPYKREES